MVDKGGRMKGGCVVGGKGRGKKKKRMIIN